MGKRGFTLVEVMISMVILSVGLLAVLKMAYVYTQGNSYNLEMGKASSVAQDKMETLRSYATSDRVDKYSVFDFDYITSTEKNFTTVWDPVANAGIAVHGLLSGSNGGSVPIIPWGTKYEVLYDDGTNGDMTGGDKIYTGSDTVNLMAVATAAPLLVNRRWTVEPYPHNVAKPDYANLEVDVYWTDRSGKDHQIVLKSVINRRQ